MATVRVSSKERNLSETVRANPAPTNPPASARIAILPDEQAFWDNCLFAHMARMPMAEAIEAADLLTLMRRQRSARAETGGSDATLARDELAVLVEEMTGQATGGRDLYQLAIDAVACARGEAQSASDATEEVMRAEERLRSAGFSGAALADLIDDVEANAAYWRVLVRQREEPRSGERVRGERKASGQ